MADVVDFLRRADLAGASRVCESNDVNGHDLLAASYGSLVEDLRTVRLFVKATSLPSCLSGVGVTAGLIRELAQHIGLVPALF